MTTARLLAPAVVLAFIGATLVFADLPWFRPTRLADRIRAYAPVARGRRGSTADDVAVVSARDLLVPVAVSIAACITRVIGADGDAAARLTRIHSPLDVAAFRLRQLSWTAAALAAATVGGAGLRHAPVAAALVVVVAPALAFLVVERQLTSASRDWQHRLFLELPVLTEQLGMLLGAGYSLGAALNRLAGRGRGASSRDLQVVCSRVRQGLSEFDTLREWAAIAEVESLDRLVAVLALNREAADLGHLVAQEARAMSRDVQRTVIESIERRAQQVWIPVTVATLVPGVIFLAVPFVTALRQFSTP